MGRRNSYQNLGNATEQFRGTHTGNGLVSFLNISKNCRAQTQEPDNLITTIVNGGDKVPPFTVSTPQIEGNLVRDKKTKEIFLPLFSSNARKCCKLVDHPSESNASGTVTPIDKFAQTARLLVSYSK